MKFAHEIMTSPAPTVAPDLSVPELGRALLQQGLDGVCVVDEGRLVGIVTAMDLIYQHRELERPSVLGVFARLGRAKAEEELAKMTGTSVREIMTPDVRTVAFDASLEVVASEMVGKHITVLPVMNGESLQGVISKADVLAAVFGKPQVHSSQAQPDERGEVPQHMVASFDD